MPDRRSPHRARQASPPGQVTRSPATAAGRGRRGNQDAPAGHAALRSNGLPAHTWAIGALSAGYRIHDRAARNRFAPPGHSKECHAPRSACVTGTLPPVLPRPARVAERFSDDLHAGVPRHRHRLRKLDHFRPPADEHCSQFLPQALDHDHFALPVIRRLYRAVQVGGELRGGEAHQVVVVVRGGDLGVADVQFVFPELRPAGGRDLRPGLGRDPSAGRQRRGLARCARQFAPFGPGELPLGRFYGLWIPVIGVDGDLAVLRACGVHGERVPGFVNGEEHLLLASRQGAGAFQVLACSGGIHAAKQDFAAAPGSRRCQGAPGTRMLPLSATAMSCSTYLCWHRRYGARASRRT